MNECFQCNRGPCGTRAKIQCEEENGPRVFPMTKCPNCQEQTHYDPEFSEQECQECGEIFYMDGEPLDEEAEERDAMREMGDEREPEE